jgi:hypothetical protein
MPLWTAGTCTTHAVPEGNPSPHGLQRANLCYSRFLDPPHDHRNQAIISNPKHGGWVTYSKACRTTLLPPCAPGST